MNKLDRFLVKLYSLAIALSVIWYTAWLLGFAPVIDMTHTAVQQGVWITVYLAVLFILSIRYLLFRTEAKSIHSFVKDTGNGEVRIGYGAVNDLSRRAAKSVSGVDRLKTQVDESPDGLVVWVKIRALAGSDLTRLSEQVQQSIMDAIRSGTSLTVSAVHVQIADLAPVAGEK